MLCGVFLWKNILKFVWDCKKAQHAHIQHQTSWVLYPHFILNEFYVRKFWYCVTYCLPFVEQGWIWQPNIYIVALRTYSWLLLWMCRIIWISANSASVTVHAFIVDNIFRAFVYQYGELLQQLCKYIYLSIVNRKTHG